ncbi:MAG: hypothetical protein AVDCRST_MAG78-3138, partial [uncultured Rubrobacteraceae bacterium]
DLQGTPLGWRVRRRVGVRRWLGRGARQKPRRRVLVPRRRPEVPRRELRRANHRQKSV